MSNKNLQKTNTQPIAKLNEKKPLGMDLEAVKTEAELSMTENTGKKDLQYKKESESFPLLGKEVAENRHLTKDDYFRFENKLREIVVEICKPLY